MAHIPQDARYVDPPTEREVDEDAVTEEARQMLDDYGDCRGCGWGRSLSDDAFVAQMADHAESCTPLRAKAEDRLYGEGE